MPKLAKNPQKSNKTVKKQPSKPSTKSGKKSGQVEASSEAASSSTSGKAKAKRPIVYEELEVRMCVGEDAMTVEQAKELLGWTEESENVKFKSSYSLLDKEEKKIRLLHNVINRPIRPGKLQLLTQEILRKRWEFNGEPIIIGKTGQILNGQHQLISLVLANQIWHKDGSYVEFWNTPPVIDKLLVVGVSEEDHVVNTLDTAESRDFTDVVFRSGYFHKVAPRHRKVLAKATDYAVRLLWDRTGASMDSFSTRRTHAESIDFVERHKRLLECVRHCFEEDGDEGKLKSRFIGIGNAAGLMYLMATCTTEREKEDGSGYIQVNHGHGSEEQLDFKMWDKAEKFWTMLASGAKELLAVSSCIADTIEGANGHISVRERLAIIVKAWNLWSVGNKVDVEELSLIYEENSNGDPQLAELPVVGGIDIGKSA